MSKVILRPDGSTANSGTVTGAGGVPHTALSDQSNGTYITFDPDESVQVSFNDITLPAGAVLKAGQLFATVSRPGSGIVSAALSGIGGLLGKNAGGAMGITYSGPTSMGVGSPFTLSGSDESPVDSAAAIASAISGVVIFYEVWLEITYVVRPTVVVQDVIT